jgi:hypothetical protein
MSLSGFSVVIVSVALVAFSASPLLSGESPSSPDLPPGPMQAKAITACIECHESRIIMQQRLNKQSWAKEVDKMIRWGAVVDPNDHDALIDYLSTNFGPDKPDYEARRTSRRKTKK